MLTPDQISQIRSAAGASATPAISTPTQSLSSKLGIQTATQTPTKMGVNKNPVDFLGSIKNAASSGVNQMKSAINESAAGKNPLETGAKFGAGAINTLFSPIAPFVEPIGQGVNALANKVSENKDLQDFATSKTGQNVARGAEFTGNLSTIAGAGAGIDETIGSIKGGIKDLNTKINQGVDGLIPKKTPTVLNETKVTDLYNRAIKPTVTGKNGAGQVAKANSQAISGLKTIADNKPNLTFTNADGETIAGATPKNVEQLSQAIQQTKQSIFKQYDALAKEAGEKGVSVDATKVASELQPIIDSKSLSIANPRAIQYAKELQSRLTDVGSIDAQTAQEVIQHYNDSLKAFYRNPSAETASQAGIDAMVANKFREELDNGISGATGEQYQQLKNQYGALSSMEKDVAHRNVVWARQNNVGLAGNLANITSGAELVRGLITMNPADIAASLAIKGVQKYIKYLNDPDVGVSRIFSEIDKSNPSSIRSTPGSEAESKLSSPSPKPTTDKINMQAGHVYNPSEDLNDFLSKDEPVAKDIKIPKDFLADRTPEDVQILQDFVDKHDINTFTKAQSLLEDLGAGKMDFVRQKEVAQAALQKIQEGGKKLAIDSGSRFTKGDKGKFTGSKKK